jgi:hypothetical protein
MVPGVEPPAGDTLTQLAEGGLVTEYGITTEGVVDCTATNCDGGATVAPAIVEKSTEPADRIRSVEKGWMLMPTLALPEAVARRGESCADRSPRLAFGVAPGAESVAEIVNEYLPGEVGVPVRFPFGLRTMPGGRDPPVTEN